MISEMEGALEIWPADKVALVLGKQKSQIRIVVCCGKCFANKMEVSCALAN